MPEPFIRYLEPDDASGLVECFRLCYGETYANETFYDAGLITSMIESGELRSVIAELDNRIVGHTGLTVRSASSLAAEAGNTVVAPDMRGQGLLGKLGTALRQRTLDEGLVGYIHYPTTAHDIMQKGATAGTGRETGIMLAYIPAETNYVDFDKQDLDKKDFEKAGRLAATIVYQPVAESPERSVYLPGRYIQPIRSLAQALNLQRKFYEPGIPAFAESLFKRQENIRRGLSNITINQIGVDLPEKAADFVGDGSTAVIHVDLNMDDPGIDYAVETLVTNGFIYSGWLPEFHQSDVLRMQMLVNPEEDNYQPNLVTEQARSLLTLMIEERKSQTG
ncbi:MAG: hypothetical protein O6945_13315 [Gammaproteobacteria bacterium]|nr:hypothetical protein [Gammaproteobacteria bacterium]